MPPQLDRHNCLSLIDTNLIIFVSLLYVRSTESQLFKTKFKDWDDVIAVDYTRTAESVSKTGADLSKWMSEQTVKIDITALFAPPPATLTEEEAQILIEDWNDELYDMKIYFLERGERFVELPESEFGHFYTEDCYVFLCHYYVPQDDITSSDEKISDHEDTRPSNGLVQNGNTNSPNDDSMNNSEVKRKHVVYFWQGRQASKMGWLTFTFTLQKSLEAHFNNLEVIQMHQQQENIKFLSHFRQKIIIHRGKRKVGLPDNPIGFYHLRANMNPLTMRCIEIEPDSSKLNSGSCYLLRLNANSVTEDKNTLPNDVAPLNRSQIYVWVGAKATSREEIIAREIASENFSLFEETKHVVHVIREGKEPETFWSYIGGKRDYETDSEFMIHSRLFRCSNDKGYFSISEKCRDFCQDDLSDDDIMILDNGSQVFLWIGPKSSEVEVKLAYKSAQVYVQNLRRREDSNPRQLMLTIKGKESKKFTKCFHAWSNHRVIQDPRP